MCLRSHSSYWTSTCDEASAGLLCSFYYTLTNDNLLHMFFICEMYVQIFIYVYKRRAGRGTDASRVIVDDAYPQILIKNDQNTTAPLKHQLYFAFRTAIQDRVSFVADVQNPDDRHYLRTEFFHCVKIHYFYRTGAHPRGRTWKACTSEYGPRICSLEQTAH